MTTRAILREFLARPGVASGVLQNGASEATTLLSTMTGLPTEDVGEELVLAMRDDFTATAEALDVEQLRTKRLRLLLDDVPEDDERVRAIDRKLSALSRAAFPVRGTA